eukprot:TRINITY_DN12051_c0_g1_i1.p1 TRINITY_DN12051_c0_g1~~TRINITY_DN12051_c0_g1_i1.p1  ORF type:complete len:478 (+),score=49.01 TRINITY_DN12051_c0_g1_i1:60-1436(+)
MCIRDSPYTPGTGKSVNKKRQVTWRMESDLMSPNGDDNPNVRKCKQLVDMPVFNLEQSEHEKKKFGLWGLLSREVLGETPRTNSLRKAILTKTALTAASSPKSTPLDGARSPFRFPSSINSGDQMANIEEIIAKETNPSAFMISNPDIQQLLKPLKHWKKAKAVKDNRKRLETEETGRVMEQYEERETRKNRGRRRRSCACLECGGTVFKHTVVMNSLFKTNVQDPGSFSRNLRGKDRSDARVGFKVTQPPPIYTGKGKKLTRMDTRSIEKSDLKSPHTMDEIAQENKIRVPLQRASTFLAEMPVKRRLKSNMTSNTSLPIVTDSGRDIPTPSIRTHRGGLYTRRQSRGDIQVTTPWLLSVPTSPTKPSSNVFPTMKASKERRKPSDLTVFTNVIRAGLKFEKARASSRQWKVLDSERPSFRPPLTPGQSLKTLFSPTGTKGSARSFGATSARVSTVV